MRFFFLLFLIAGSRMCDGGDLPQGIDGATRNAIKTYTDAVTNGIVAAANTSLLSGGNNIWSNGVASTSTTNGLITVRAYNNSVGSVDAASQQFRISIIHYKQ